jgi:hypothetical protein
LHLEVAVRQQVAKAIAIGRDCGGLGLGFPGWRNSQSRRIDANRHLPHLSKRQLHGLRLGRCLTEQKKASAEQEPSGVRMRKDSVLHTKERNR